MDNWNGKFKDGWYPISFKGLPPETGFYLVSDRDNSVYGRVFNKDDDNWIDWNCAESEILAWQEFPKPYKM